MVGYNLNWSCLKWKNILFHVKYANSACFKHPTYHRITPRCSSFPLTMCTGMVKSESNFNWSVGPGGNYALYTQNTHMHKITNLLCDLCAICGGVQFNILYLILYKYEWCIAQLLHGSTNIAISCPRGYVFCPPQFL